MKTTNPIPLHLKTYDIGMYGCRHLVTRHWFVFGSTCWTTLFNSSWPSDTIWQQGSGSILAQVMACCLTAPCHYLNQCWLIISEVMWHSPEGNSTVNAQDIYPWYEFEYCKFNITVTFPIGQWVNNFSQGCQQHCTFCRISTRSCLTSYIVKQDTMYTTSLCHFKIYLLHVFHSGAVEFTPLDAAIISSMAWCWAGVRLSCNGDQANQPACISEGSWDIT